PLGGVDDSVGARRVRRAAGEAEHVAERGLVLRQRELCDGAPVKTRAVLVVTAGCGHFAKRRLRMHVTWEAHERLAVASFGRKEPAGVEVEVPQLDESPGGGLPRPGPRLDGELHRGDCRPRASEELAPE